MLYIPIWYNSSLLMLIATNAPGMIFTFQSGTIQALSSDCIRAADAISLHSNLVQFKPKTEASNKSIRCSFTFQSGTIQAKLCAVDQRPHCAFTFQSGTIQAIKAGLKKLPVDNLYIPIWYNSSYCVHIILPPTDQTLHSNLVQFKRILVYPILIPLFPLHSNLVQFKLLHADKIFSAKFPLHSNLVQFKLCASHSINHS